MSKHYLTAAQVRQRYGDRSDSWLWRILQDDPRFPRPKYLKGKRLFDEAELDAYDEGMPEEVANASAA